MKLDDQPFASVADGAAAFPAWTTATRARRRSRAADQRLARCALQMSLAPVPPSSSVSNQSCLAIGMLWCRAESRRSTARRTRAHRSHAEGPHRPRAACAVTPVDSGKPKSAREMVTAAVNTPLLISVPALRVTTFSLQGRKSARCRSSFTPTSGQTIRRRATRHGWLRHHRQRRPHGRLAAWRSAPAARDERRAVGVAVHWRRQRAPSEHIAEVSPSTRATASATVEHEFGGCHAIAGTLRVSDLMAGWSAERRADDLLQPTVSLRGDVRQRAGMSKYGDGAQDLTAKFELAASATPRRSAQDVVMRPAGGGQRAIFTRPLPVRQLPPGKYVLRAAGFGSRSLQTLASLRSKAAPAVLMTSAESGAALSTG